MKEKNTVIKTHLDQHTLWVTLNRPEKHNAVNFEVMAKLEEVISRVEQDDNIRVMVLVGAGDRSFISGGDLQDFHTITAGDEAAFMARKMLNLLERLERLPCWTIACINGDTYGGGCEIALAFDFRISFPAVTLAFTQSKFYLPPGWGGLTRLVEKVGRSTALKWLGGGEKISGQIAFDYHFLDELSPHPELKKNCASWSEQLSKNDRAFIANLKEQSRKAKPQRWEHIANETAAFAEFWADPQHLERVKKFLDRK